MLIDRYKLFIFDWDGTLSTSTSLVKITRILKRRYDVARIMGSRDQYRIETVPQFNRKEENNELYALVYGIYSLFYRPVLKPGTLELLKALKKRGKKVAIFSDSNRYRLFIEVKKLGILDYVDFMLSADSIKRFKPNPTGIMMIVNNFKCSKSKCIYVGDMASDVFAAKFAGVASCAVGDGVDSYDLLKSVKPDYMIGDIASLGRLK